MAVMCDNMGTHSTIRGRDVKGYENEKNQRGSAENIGVLIFSAAFVICLAAWITHIVNCLSEEAWGFLIAGAIMFPIAIIHGIGLWFGFF